MAALDHDRSPKPLDEAPQTLGQKVSRWLEDPFGSMWAGLIAPFAAVGVVMSGILGLAVAG